MALHLQLQAGTKGQTQLDSFAWRETMRGKGAKTATKV